MRNLAIVLIGLSAVGFLLAVIAVAMSTSIVGVTPEGFSRGCSNLALIAIALAVWFGKGNT
jgi:hypothetical protein